MRISDWSSDVCSSDLHLLIFGGERRMLDPAEIPVFRMMQVGEAAIDQAAHEVDRHRRAHMAFEQTQRIGNTRRGGEVRRSEEHTSELQSLMRISYAVFCLKKKKK